MTCYDFVSIGNLTGPTAQYVRPPGNTRSRQDHIAGMAMGNGHAECLEVFRTILRATKRHLVRLHSLLVAYIVEVADVVAGENSKAAEAGAAVAAIDASMPAQALN